MQHFTKMTFIKSRIFSLLSILLSTIALIGIIKINHDIAIRYLALDRKAHLLLGLTNFLGFYFKFYVIITISLVSEGLSIIAFKKKESRTMNMVACFLGITSLLIVLFNIWKFSN